MALLSGAQCFSSYRKLLVRALYLPAWMEGLGLGVQPLFGCSRFISSVLIVNLSQKRFVCLCVCVHVSQTKRHSQLKTVTEVIEGGVHNNPVQSHFAGLMLY